MDLDEHDPKNEALGPAADPMAVVNSTVHGEPVEEDIGEDYISHHDIEHTPSEDDTHPDKQLEKAYFGSKDHSETSSVSNSHPTRPKNLRRTTTSATDASRATTTGSMLDGTPTFTKDKRWYKNLNPLKWGAIPPVPKERVPNREEKANFLSKLTFQWMAKMMHTGYQRPLQENDIPLVHPERSAELMAQRVKVNFEKRVKRGDRHPLIFSVYETFKFDFWLGGFCQLTAAIIQVLSPFTLRYLIAFAQEAYYAQADGGSGPSIGDGLGLVFGILAMQMIQSICTNHFIYRGMLMGGMIRATLISLIFEKAMRVSNRVKAGSGKAESESPDALSGDDLAALKMREEQAMKDLQEIMDSQPRRALPFRIFDRKIGVNSRSAKEIAVGPPLSPEGWSNGRIVNLMSTDTYRIDTACGLFHMIWTSPVSITITLVVLLVNLTYSALAGFSLLMISVPALTQAVKLLIARRRAINVITDQRVSLTQEILQAVRFVKYFGWESSFLKRLSDIRKREIRSIQVLLTVRNAILAVSMSMPVFASMLAFITYSLTDHALNPAPIFSSLALFNSLRLPLNMLPMVIGQVTDAVSSFGRIQNFLMSEDANDEAKYDPSIKDAIVVEKADFTWEKAFKDVKKDAKGGKLGAGKTKESKGLKEFVKKMNILKRKKNKVPPQEEITQEKRPGSAGSEETVVTDAFKLLDINLAVKRKELIAIIGTVGSGKSSLLAAMAGEMRRTAGEVTLGASRAFCPQYAWIQNTTVQQNILFGKPMDKKWYDAVVEACALEADLDMLPAGDLTEIGERGITVSGGQKQRLNIARAIYFDADIVIMDDPLSAVDAHVGRHIFDNAICGLLKDKCRILATHQLHVLNRCDRIVWMQEGRIEIVDTFANLMERNEAFRKMMATTAQEEKQEEAEEVLEDEIEAEKKIAKKRAAKENKKGAALMQQEERATTTVTWPIYKAYLKASGSYFNGPIGLLLLITSQGSNIATSLWLSWWTSNNFGFETGVYIGVYAALGVSQALLLFLFSSSVSVMGTNASRRFLHNAMRRVLRAPMSFFDTTPLGRITNRFAKDVDTLDNNLTDNLRMFAMTMGMIVSVFILIIVYFYYFAIALGPLLVLFVFSASYYRSSARELKRHEAVLRSHVFARFGEAVSGTASIRAYGVKQQFVNSVNSSLDNMDSAYYLTFANQRWLAVRLDMIGNLLVLTTGILVVTSRFNVGPSTSGLVLSYILSIVQMIQFTVRQLAEVENSMNAAERIHYYGTELEEEAPLQLGQVPAGWPVKGAIDFEDVQMRYRTGLPLVLQGLDLKVAGGERIGIVGRTGAGKSSIMSTLFRLVELSGGSIKIDGIDIAKIGLNDLRSKLAIIPQDPTLFKGTVRSNLDPFGEHSDLELWSALRQANLVDAEIPTPDATEHSKLIKNEEEVDEKLPKEKDLESSSSENANQPHGVTATIAQAKVPQKLDLDTPVVEEGLNFSLGQRQLLALARALVRNSRIIVCDEATSSVDVDTDNRIQHTIATAFKGRTLLCIAHRLKTIIGYDRILVMSAGRVEELGPPKHLWDSKGVFWGMCEKAGITAADFEKREY